MENINDETLIRKYLEGDENSLEVLIKKYLKPIYNFLYRYLENQQDAEDATQKTFIKVWRNLKKFDQKRSFKIWIFQIAKNTAIDFIRKKKEILFSEFENEVLNKKIIDPASLKATEISEKAEISQKINLIVKTLPSKYRMILLLHYNDHFTFREIAEILNEPLNTIKSRHQRAILILRKILKGQIKNK